METTLKLSNGHYQNGLPWKNQPPHLENNSSQAEIRLQMLKKRLQKDTTLHEKYTDFMADLLQNATLERWPLKNSCRGRNGTLSIILYFTLRTDNLMSEARKVFFQKFWRKQHWSEETVLGH